MPLLRMSWDTLAATLACDGLTNLCASCLPFLLAFADMAQALFGLVEAPCGWWSGSSLHQHHATFHMAHEVAGGRRIACTCCDLINFL